MSLAQRLPIAPATVASPSPVDELLEALPAAVVMVDGDGRIQRCNAAADELLAMPLLGELWRELTTRLFIPRPDIPDALQLHTGRLVTLSTRPFANLRGQVLMFHDVTESYRLQHRLNHQQRLADMGRMAASLAHQIRTPLATAMLYVSQLKSVQPDPARREHLVAKALTGLRGLERLINDMLLFVNSGQGSLDSLSAAALLAELAQEMEQPLADKGIALHYQVSPCRCEVMANRTLLKSALQNILNNAEQALQGREGARIVLSALEQEGQVRLCIADNGPGIEVARQEAIFEPFVSGRSSGTGLGLAVVRAIARSFGGEAEVESEHGVGSCFCLRLPCK